MAEWNYEIVWKETMNQIKGELGEQEFAMWFNLEYLRATENEIVIAVPSKFYLDQVTQRYQEYLETKVQTLIGKNVSVSLEVKPFIKATPPQGKDPEENKPPDTATVKPKKAHPQLRQDYTFDKYVIGENNNFAANAATAISRNPGAAYNPLLIYGGVGLGKTHLMQAIGNYIHANSDKKIICISAETFTNEFILAIPDRKQMGEFKNRYRKTDVLLIDDIHFFQKKDGSQEELFFTYEALYNENKQIIFTCDRPVSELKNITDRLRSRFERGLNVQLLPPDYETSFAILKMKANAKNAKVSDDILTLISNNIKTNIRDLEAALTKLIAYADLLGKPITLEIAQKQLQDMFVSPKQPNLSLEIIQKVVADYFNVSFIDLKGKKKTQAIVNPRQIAMYISREITENSTTEIGLAFGGKDHSTVMHACQKIEERIKVDPTLDPTIKNLIRMIKEYSVKS